MLQIKPTVTEMRNAFGWLASRVETAEKRTSELGAMAIAASKLKSKKAKQNNKTSKQTI